MIAVFNCEGVFVLQRDHRISEINSMFTEIVGSLPWIPLKVRELIACTIRVHVNVDKRFYLSEA